MNAMPLLSTPERLAIIKKVIYLKGPLSVNKTAKELGLSQGLVSKVFEILVKEKIAKRQNAKILIFDNLKTRALKIFLNLAQLNTGIFKKHKFVQAAGLYGSAAKGTNTEESDIDVWIYVKDAGEEEKAKLSKQLKKHGNIAPLYLNKEKLAKLKKEDALFYHSLCFGSITLYGENIERL